MSRECGRISHRRPGLEPGPIRRVVNVCSERLLPGLRFDITARGYGSRSSPGRRLARRHSGTDFGAQFVDQFQALVGLDVPEGPAVAGAGALRYRADAVDRADLVAEHDGAAGADQRAVTLPG